MYIKQGRISVYAIRKQLGRIRDRVNDDYIYIGMSGNKNITQYLQFFADSVTEFDKHI